MPTVQIEFDFSDPRENFQLVAWWMEDVYQDEMDYISNNSAWRFKQEVDKFLEEKTLESRDRKVIRDRARRRYNNLVKAWDKEIEEYNA